jgi:glycosyltransferase involved in cell wall biosynthesis
VLFVARSRYRLPLSDTLALKWDALSAELELRVLASALPGSRGHDPRFRLLRPLPRLDGPLFWLRLPFALGRELRRFRPDAIVAQAPYEAAVALLLRPRARVVVDVHGDWRTSTRLYGSPARRALSGLADRVADLALRRADAVRSITPYTTRLVGELGLEPAAEFPAYMDLRPFLEPPAPLPEEPVALFVGVLERYKNVDGLVAAWREVVARLPAARLRIAGNGTLAPLVERLVAELPGRTEWLPSLDTAGVARVMDEARLLVLPSRSEGMGRVVVEALARGRPVLGANVGGIPDLVQDGENGVLVEPSAGALADALVALLGDPERVARLAAGARASVEPWLATPEQYAARVRDLVAPYTGPR